ncbi:unnamed protein product [Microthlaspi erraticum]|uniref:Uncharacterized protein n=1 Tax=Microthlaspi erraticum TaxID=1685480 RepID=A0A6D2ILS5_9BRAS|nr:unnamed protein product [Microthlaspi erraticum]
MGILIGGGRFGDDVKELETARVGSPSPHIEVSKEEGPMRWRETLSSGRNVRPRKLGSRDGFLWKKGTMEGEESSGQAEQRSVERHQGSSGPEGRRDHRLLLFRKAAMDDVLGARVIQKMKLRASHLVKYS